jgi:hypothetical protein
MVGTTGAPLENVPKESIVSLEMILNACRIEAKFESTICKVVKSIGWIEKAAVEHNNLNYELFNTVELLEEIGLLACKHGTKLEHATRQVVDSIFWIGKTAVEPNKENESVALKVISSLENVGKVAEKNPDSVTRRTVGNLKELRSIVSKDCKPTEIGRRILLRLNQTISKFEK